MPPSPRLHLLLREHLQGDVAAGQSSKLKNTGRQERRDGLNLLWAECSPSSQLVLEHGQVPFQFHPPRASSIAVAVARRPCVSLVLDLGLQHLRKRQPKQSTAA